MRFVVSAIDPVLPMVTVRFTVTWDVPIGV
jgi:hypothetical protein